MSEERAQYDAIRLKGITKTFGEVTANDSINLTVRYGEILALLGENGSGKTTLMNILSGIYHPDHGEIFIDGEETVIASPADAIRQGIGMIHQHFKLVDAFTAMDNIVLGTKGRYEKPSLLKARIEKLSALYGLEVDPEKYIYEMSVSERQTVEVLKVLYRGARILILDEPTAVLTPQETSRLFSILRKMREQGSAIIIITHKLNEVMELSDRVTILRKGKSIQTIETAKTNEQQLTEQMVGRPVNLSIERVSCEAMTPKLVIDSLTVKKADGTDGIKDISFTLFGGEILGIAGIAGSGQKELYEAIAGLRTMEKGRIRYNGEETEKLTLAYVPEDRLGMGLVGAMGVTGNLLLRSYRDQKGVWIRKKEAAKEAKRLIEQMEIKTPYPDFPVRMLSGGNVQKVLLGRELNRQPNVIVAAYPVRGLDIQSSYLVYELLNKQKEKGAAILFAGEDLDVLLALCDRILVLCQGEMIGIVQAEETTKEEVGLMMAGVKGVKRHDADSSEEEGADNPD